MFTLAVPSERALGERRVSLVPAVVKRLVAELDVEILIEKGAGDLVYIGDKDFEQAGAKIVDNSTLYANAEAWLGISPPADSILRKLPEKSKVIGFMGAIDDERYRTILARRLTVLAMERIPRTTRAQAMDALSSQRSVAGYFAVVAGASRFDRFFPMITGPTGTVRPTTVLIIGAGVAGLQAVATARRLGAVVEVSDIRAAAREQVESLGAKFVGAKLDAEAQGGYARELTPEEKQAQADELARHIAKSGVLITTAEIPGRPAPKMVSRAMIESMKPGSLVIDLAAGSGGNCELTRVDQTIDHNGVRIWGPRNMATYMPAQASELYAQNLRHLITLLVKEGQWAPDWDDDILAAIGQYIDGKKHPQESN